MKKMEIHLDNMQKGIYFIFRVIAAVFMMIFFVMTIIMYPHNTTNFALEGILLITAAVGVACFLTFVMQKQKNMWLDIAIIFILALLPRIILALKFQTIPYSDFEWYYKAGAAMAQGELYHPDLLEFYSRYNSLVTGIPYAYGAIGAIFGTSIFSFQIGFSVITSFIVVMVYLIGKQIQRNIGLLAALLYAFYPGNIMAAQVFTNQHFSILFILVAFYLIFLSVKKVDQRPVLSVVLGLLGAVGITCARLILPNTPVMVASAIIYLAIFTIVQLKKWKSRLVMLVIVLFIIVLPTVGSRLLFNQAVNMGWITKQGATAGVNYTGKIVVGINPETRGGYSYDFYNMSAIKDERERSLYQKELLQERISSPQLLLNTLYGKTRNMWASPDVMYYWYQYNGIKGLSEKSVAGEELSVSEQKYIDQYNDRDGRYQYTDQPMLMMAYLFAAIGVFRKKGMTSGHIFNLILILLLGWIGAHLLIEVQPRYRYFIMPVIFIFVASGAYYVRDGVQGFWKKLLKKTETSQPAIEKKDTNLSMLVGSLKSIFAKMIYITCAILIFCGIMFIPPYNIASEFNRNVTLPVNAAQETDYQVENFIFASEYEKLSDAEKTFVDTTCLVLPDNEPEPKGMQHFLNEYINNFDTIDLNDQDVELVFTSDFKGSIFNEASFAVKEDSASINISVPEYNNLEYVVHVTIERTDSSKGILSFYSMLDGEKKEAEEMRVNSEQIKGKTTFNLTINTPMDEFVLFLEKGHYKVSEFGINVIQINKDISGLGTDIAQRSKDEEKELKNGIVILNNRPIEEVVYCAYNEQSQKVKEAYNHKTYVVLDDHNHVMEKDKENYVKWVYFDEILKMILCIGIPIGSMILIFGVMYLYKKKKGKYGK